MKIMPGCLLWDTIGREKAEEMCCLHALGELSPEENAWLEEHLRHCKNCAELSREFERVMLFDLAASAVVRLEDTVAEEPENVREGELLASIRQRASNARGTLAAALRPPVELQAAPRGARWRRIVRVAWPITCYAAGCMAAVFLLVLFLSRPPGRGSDAAALQGGPVNQLLAPQDVELRAQLQRDQAQMMELQQQLSQAQRSDRSAELGFTRLSRDYRGLQDTFTALQTQFAQEQSAVEEKDAELALARKNVNEEAAAKESLLAQLSEIDDRLQKQSNEVARLERVASTVPASFPVTEHEVNDGEAKEILGARDLHIVDVYDVDNFGKSSRAYGRIYYVNRSQLVFYAFDLSKLESNHKVVAFQAWGFRQPQSSSVESLGLFYMDNATLNRWTLRVSDPRILSRIDTPFVTVEPPGGSRFPKGRRLLMASLAGPPNHP